MAEEKIVITESNGNKTEAGANKVVKESANKKTREINPDDLIVGYFSYNTLLDADRARNEQDKILKLEKQVNYDNPRQVYALYSKLLSGDFFHTQEGMLYLVHLQDYLYSKEKALPGPIPPIPSEYIRDKSKKTPEQLEQEKATLLGKVRSLESDKSKAYKNIRIKQKKTDNLIYKIVIGALVLVILAMLIISGASSSPNILNYRNQIQNEYSDWEQKLNDKEKELRQREKDLKKAEEATSEQDSEQEDSEQNFEG